MSVSRLNLTRRTAIQGALGFMGGRCLRVPLKDHFVKFGWLAPLSFQPTRAATLSMQQAVELRVQELNQNGGILGRPIKLILSDAGGAPNSASSALLELASREQVAGIVSASQSLCALAESRAAARVCVPWISTAAESDQITESGSRAVFRISPADSLILQRTAEWIAATRPISVIVVVESLSKGERLGKKLAASLRSRNIKVHIMPIASVESDPSHIAQQVYENHPDADFFDITGVAAPQFEIAKFVYAIYNRRRVTILASPNIRTQGATLEASDWGNRVWALAPLASPQVYRRPVVSRFVQSYRNRAGYSPTDADAASYDAVSLLAAAIAAAGSTKSLEITEALAHVKHLGLRASYSFSTETSPAWHYHQFLHAPVTPIQPILICGGPQPIDAKRKDHGNCDMLYPQ